jgi:hypothetical protein
LALRKKPVRKPVAKTTATTTSKVTTTSKARTTRAKKTEPEPEPESDGDQTEDELQLEGPAPTKVTRRNIQRANQEGEPVKKAPAKAAVSKPEPPSKAPAKASKSTVTKATTKPKAPQKEAPRQTVVQKAPELVPTQSRATRATRATAAKNKATPLSPKKVSQVSQVPKNSTKSTTQKGALAKGAISKPIPRGRPPLRRRNVSDENADVPELESRRDGGEKDEEESEDEDMDCGHVAKLAVTTRSRAASTRATSPMEIDHDAHATSLSARKQNTTEDVPEQSTNSTEDTDSADESEQVSVDELIGAKTPMKRSGSSDEDIFPSVKADRTSDIELPAVTPVRHFRVLGTQMGTPQTQKPYCKPSVPMSGLEPMTVARASNRSMVFPPLRSLPQVQESFETPDATIQEEEIPTPEVAHQESPFDHEIPEETDQSEFIEQDSDTTLLVDPSLQNGGETREITQQSLEDDRGEPMTLESIKGREPEAENTIPIDEEDPQADHDDSFESVIITRQRPDDVSEGTKQPRMATPRTETMVWENLRPDIIIPFKFDGNVSPSRTLPPTEPTERLSIIAALRSPSSNACDGDEQDGSSTPSDLASNEAGTPRQTTLSTRQSLDASINISTFIDLAPLSEPCQATEMDVEHEADLGSQFTPNGKQPTLEDAAEAIAISEGDATLLCEEPVTPLVIRLSPVKLTTVEDISEDSPTVEGDMTLHLEEPTCPATVKRSPIKLSSVEDVAEDEYIGEGDVTLALEEASCPGTIRRSPIKLTVAEDVPEDDCFDEGDMTLVLEEGPCPRTIRRSPIKLTVAEDVSEDEADVDGEVTMMLESPTRRGRPHAGLTPNGHGLLDMTGTPHYALPTISSRRKSLSAADAEKPELYGEDTQPTLDFRRPIVANPVGGAWFDKVDSPSKTPSGRSRPTTPHRMRSLSRSRSPVKTPTARTPVSKTPRISMAPLSVKRTPGDRFPGLPSRKNYEEHLVNVSKPATPSTSKEASLERYPGMPPRNTYEELLGGKTPSTTSLQPSTARKSSAKRKVPHDETPVLISTATPETESQEQIHDLPSRKIFEKQAHTARPASRFRTPSKQMSSRRPTTTHKPTSLRKLALHAATPSAARRSARTPVKGAADSPGQMALTPHPAAPLKGVIALVDVYTSDGSCASQSFTDLLKRLGAKTTKTFSDRVTHVIFKDGSPKLLQQLVLHNRQAAESDAVAEIYCVNSRWVNDCEARGRRLSESGEEYAVDIDDLPRTAKRRRKSMEPMSLLNTGGNITRDRKSSLGRMSHSRMSIKGVVDSPSEDSSFLFAFNAEDKENTDGSEPPTPAYLKEPSSLVQQTVPVKRVRKLDLGEKEKNKQRRLTFMEGLEF